MAQPQSVEEFESYLEMYGQDIGKSIEIEFRGGQKKVYPCGAWLMLKKKNNRKAGFFPVYVRSQRSSCPWGDPKNKSLERMAAFIKEWEEKGYVIRRIDLIHSGFPPGIIHDYFHSDLKSKQATVEESESDRVQSQSKRIQQVIHQVKAKKQKVQE